jgi:hypothetical protein
VYKVCLSVGSLGSLFCKYRTLKGESETNCVPCVLYV